MEYEGLENLSQDQKDKVHNYMAIMANDDVKLAIQFLESCNYNLEV